MPKNNSSKRKKYSLEERANYYNNLYAKSNKKKKAFIAGFLDVVYGSTVDSSSYKTTDEAYNYHKGVDRGEKALKKSRQVKF